MTGLGAEMGHVDDGGWIIGQHGQGLPRRNRLQPLTGFQNRQGAQKTRGIQMMCISHTNQIGRMFQPVHRHVTGLGVTPRLRRDRDKDMFGIDIIDASLVPAMSVALLAGIISFLSPCVLPIVPPYLAYMSGMTVSEMSEGGSGRSRATITALFFVLGLSTVFLFLGFAASAFGAFFLSNQVLFSQISGAVIMIFGLHFLGVFRIPFLDQEARMDAGDQGGSSFGAYVLGLAFAFGWTPCIGPQLGAILTLAASEASVTRGTLLLGVYAAGLGIPFLLAAMFMSRAMGFMNRIKTHMKLIERVMGGLLLLVGAAMLFGLFTRFSFWLLERFPALATLG